MDDVLRWGHAARRIRRCGCFHVTTERSVTLHLMLSEPCSNNVTKYQALIARLQMALDMKIAYLKVYDDSKLVINQLFTHYEVKHEGLIPYFQMAT